MMYDIIELPEPGVRVAEQVLDGHPDRMADAIAESIVQYAIGLDARAVVQVEVMVHRDWCALTGRRAVSDVALSADVVERLVRDAYRAAGFGVPFCASAFGPGVFQGPALEAVEIVNRISLEVLDPVELAERHLSDDQCIAIGHAEHGAETDWLPIEQWLSLCLRSALVELCATERALGAGPDGKVMVVLDAAVDGRWRVREVVVSVQHLASASVVRIERAVRAVVQRTVEREAGRCRRWLVAPDGAVAVRFNTQGEFVVGGPMGDNGQTGRKLVRDAYGPRVPVGVGRCWGRIHGWGIGGGR
nr:hypothetical protein [Gemmatimonadaceae bacterium]